MVKGPIIMEFLGKSGVLASSSSLKATEIDLFEGKRKNECICQGVKGKKVMVGRRDIGVKNYQGRGLLRDFVV